MNLDLHNFAQRYNAAETFLRGRTDVTDHNKDAILRFRDACLLHQVCGKVRLIRVFIVLGQASVLLGKDFEGATREDIERIITAFMRRLAPSSMALYKSIIKRFYGFLLFPDQFPRVTNQPPQVAWLRTTVRRADQRRLQRNDLLTPTDIQALLGICRNPRDKALFAVLWETGGRIGEVGNLQVKHVTRVAHGYTLDFSGKTGQRTPLIVSAAPYLSQWLANHPFRDQPDAPLWVHNQYAGEPKPLMYTTIRHLLQRYFARAGIKKPVHPHVFRHARATYMLAAGLMNESQAKNYFGWTPDSHMLATYSHLIDQDANNAILRENNLTPERAHHDALKPLLCHVCGELNAPQTDYCTKCSAVLNLKKAYEHQQLHTVKDEVVLNLVQILVEKGLLDDAARAIHEAKLGNALKTVAEHHANNPSVPTTAKE
jgi:integrase